MASKIKTLSLFCGCGGMDLGIVGGFEYLGKRYPKLPYEIILAVDNDPYCTQIYNENFKTKCEIRDVKALDEKTLDDLICLLEDSLVSHFPYPHRIRLDSDIKMNEENCFLKW